MTKDAFIKKYGRGFYDGLRKVSVEILRTTDLGTQYGLINEGATATKFITLNASGRLRFRTATELLADIGAAPATDSPNYIWNSISPQDDGNFNITGDGTIGGLLTAAEAVFSGPVTLSNNVWLKGIDAAGAVSYGLISVDVYDRVSIDVDGRGCVFGGIGEFTGKVTSMGAVYGLSVVALWNQTDTNINIGLLEKSTGEGMVRFRDAGTPGVFVDLIAPVTATVAREVRIPDADGTMALTVSAVDHEITDNTKGLIQKSPDGTRWRLAISNAGAVSAALA